VYCTVQAARDVFRYAITALTPDSEVLTRLLLPEIRNVHSKQCPLVERTCAVNAMDASTKPSTVPHGLRIASRYATTAVTIYAITVYCTVQAARDVFRYAITALTPDSTVPTRLLSPEIGNVLSKQCALIETTTCEVNVMPFLLQAVSTPVATTLSTPAVLEGEEVTDAPGSDRLLFVTVPLLLAIWYYCWLAFIRVDADDAVFEDVGDGPEEADDGVAVQDDVPVEAPVPTVTIAAPLRRSKRVAAQQCRAVFPGVAPNACAARGGPRRSARLAAKPRVNYKA
jgi:hypothetical protein